MTFPIVKTTDGVRLHVTDSGASGAADPILFLHEFAGNYRSWAAQVAALCDEHRCITFAARGYPPSDVPANSDAYSWQRAVDDAVAVLDALDIESAHIVGISMGGYTAVQVGLKHPERVRSVMAVSVGSGSDPGIRSAYLEEARIVADQLRARGTEFVGRSMAEGPSRIQLKNRSAAAWQQMIDQFAEQSADGMALTILEVQAKRPSFHDLLDELSTFARPLLVVDGDEDEACLSTGRLLKQTVPACGWRVLPNSGHVLNLEDPALFNDIVRRFIAQVEVGAWPERDPRSKVTLQFNLESEIAVSV
ncbi:alpha/beta fold hydrolase [Subtercola lobariae]|uniref:Alpha/beta hydrolase n=1 Tax=Subtercola lobariae TaxID=1588641 RepID=A0A917BH95_9MICO|nr:alpha/beta hydrolase [Subtercola lobariae]GGF41736.1 alpha/beta hydrolase [Subtercola lobariae]